MEGSRTRGQRRVEQQTLTAWIMSKMLEKLIKLANENKKTVHKVDQWLHNRMKSIIEYM